MSDKKQETIADIVAQMRSNEFDDPSFNVYSLVAARTLLREDGPTASRRRRSARSPNCEKEYQNCSTRFRRFMTKSVQATELEGFTASGARLSDRLEARNEKRD